MMTQTITVAIHPVAPFEHAPILALALVVCTLGAAIFAWVRLLSERAVAP